ncbi:MAG: hypothetical protein ACYDAR_08540 [Thermomicrobiales bacterium]
MPILWSKTEEYHVEPYATETELESAVIEVGAALFGASRIYLDVKKKIGGTTKNIPDGYLIDLSSTKQPVLYVVENELASHDHLRHIAAQILQFSLSFDSTPQAVKGIIRGTLDANPAQRKQCESYALANGFENLDYLLEQMIYKGGFQALVVIDELQDDLETVLVRRFKFGVEVLTLTRYVNSKGHRIYQFDPFLADVTSQPAKTESGKVLAETTGKVDPSDIDTIVVPAREDGFKETALGENRWYSIRIHGSMIPRIKYLAVYRVKPTSAITHIAPVQSIEPWERSGKYVVNFAEPLQQISPIKLVPDGKIKALQNARYTSRDRLLQSTNLDSAF